MSSEEEDEEMPEVSATSVCEEIHQRAEHGEKGAEMCKGSCQGEASGLQTEKFGSKSG